MQVKLMGSPRHSPRPHPASRIPRYTSPARTPPKLPPHNHHASLSAASSAPPSPTTPLRRDGDAGLAPPQVGGAVQTQRVRYRRHMCELSFGGNSNASA
jgi:hypothetical protein